MAYFGNLEATLSIAVGSDTSVPDPQNADLTESEFAALTWQEIPNVVNGPDTGGSTSFVERMTWADKLTGSFQGGVSGNESEIRLAIQTSNDSDGRTALLAAAADVSNEFAFKFQWPNGRIEYGRLLIGEPTLTKGAKEDPPEEVFSTKVVQLPVFSSV